jgi:hypothetical protein
MTVAPAHTSWQGRMLASATGQRLDFHYATPIRGLARRITRRHTSDWSKHS